MDWNAASETRGRVGEESTLSGNPTNARVRRQPGVYWAFEQTAPPWLDSTGNNHHLLTTSGITTTDEMGLIGSGVGLYKSAVIGQLSLITQFGAAGILDDFTAFGWTKFATTENGFIGIVQPTISPTQLATCTLGMNPPGGTFSIFSTIPAGHAAMVIDFSGAGVPSDVIVDCGVGPTNGQWFFWAFWYEHSNQRFAFQINLGTINYANLSAAIPDDFVEVTYRAFGSQTGSGELETVIDETGISTRILTPTEKTFLYNAGAGRTWPSMAGLL